MTVSRTAPVIYKRQAQILDFIKQSIENTGFAPTLRDIANAIGVNSLATVHEHVQGLVEKGLLKRTSGRLRKMELTTDINTNNEGITVPILGYIAAGSPIKPMTDPSAHMSIPPNFASKTKRVYVLQVRGQSMIEDHIDDGDFVICDQFIDRTSARKDTFFDGPITTHISGAEPYCNVLRNIAGSQTHRPLFFKNNEFISDKIPKQTTKSASQSSNITPEFRRNI